MKKILLALVLVVVAVGLMAGRSTGSITRWEYYNWLYFVDTKAQLRRETIRLDSLGREGWELVGVIPRGDIAPQMTARIDTYIFKRPIP